MSEIEKAADIIKKGGLVAFPTETVYGLGADAANEEACLRIFGVKERPNNNPLIVHVASIEEAKTLAVFNDVAEKVAMLWPGPITLVLPKKKGANIAKCVTADLDTIAIRIPSEQIALDLIKKSGCAIAAPSANKSGKLSSTNEYHVSKNFGDTVFTINSKKKAVYGIESTILDLTTTTPVVLRLGFFSPDMLKEILKTEVLISSNISKIKAPGMLLKHYAPKTKLKLNGTYLNKGEVGLNFKDSNLISEISLNLSIDGDLVEAASNLYEHLHRLDDFCQKNNYHTIVVANIPNHGIGLAINDRLNRASK